MDSIPPLFWMFIITLLSVGFFMILFYVAMAVRESVNTLKESTGVLREVKDIVRETKTIVSDIQLITGSVRKGMEKLTGVVDTINNSLVKPIKAIGQFFGFVTSFLPIGKDDEDEILD
jgi:hypothetical protein